MKIKSIFITLLLIGCQMKPSTHQQHDVEQNLSLDQYCQKFVCRGESIIALRTENGDFRQTMSYFWPQVQQDAISILPGEKLFIEADLGVNSLFNLKRVETNVNPEKTMVLEFNQIEGSYAMMLSITNPFDVSIKFNMEMMDFKGELHKTTSCPIGVKSSLFETWPHPILQLFIINPSILTEKEVHSCEY